MTASLEGKVALVTGGSSGIGLAIARRLAANGAAVALVASSDAGKAAYAAETIVVGGGAATPFVADITRPIEAERLLEEVGSTIGAPDILVNAAGVWFPTPLADLTEDQLSQMLDVNLSALIRMTAKVAPGMIARGAGHILNIASVAGLVPSPGYSLYVTSKAGVIAFTKAAALELAPHGVTVNAIAPGNTATPMNTAVRKEPQFAARRDWIERTTPSTRSFTPVDEVADLALALVDGRFRGIHGAVIPIDEGRSAGLTARLD